MANHNATGKKAKHGAQLGARWRAAILNTFDAVEKEGKLISEILAEEFKKNPIKFMELASKGIPKEIEGSFDHVLRAENLTDDQLADIAAGRSSGTDKAQTSQKVVH